MNNDIVGFVLDLFEYKNSLYRVTFSDGPNAEKDVFVLTKFDFDAV